MQDAPPRLVAAHEAPPALPSLSACLDCGAPRLGAFCQECGQHHMDDHLTLRVVWREFAERFLRLERGLPATVRLALLDPGRLAREYVHGRRRRYVNPVSFLLLGSALAVLLIPLYASTERMTNDPSLPTHSRESVAASVDMGIRIAGGDPADMPAEERERIITESIENQEAFMTAYLTAVNKLYSVFSVVLALALAGSCKLFFNGRQPSYTFAETLVLGCFFAGTYTALTSVLASGMAPFVPLMVSSAVTTLLLIGGAAYAATGFYGRSWSTVGLGAISGIAAFGVYMLSVVLMAIPVALFSYL